jgi:hypothetical protein
VNLLAPAAGAFAAHRWLAPRLGFLGAAAPIVAAVAGFWLVDRIVNRRPASGTGGEF